MFLRGDDEFASSDHVMVGGFRNDTCLSGQIILGPNMSAGIPIGRY